MSRICNHLNVDGTTRCQNVVADWQNHCRVGHSCPPVTVEHPFAGAPTVGLMSFDIEELIKPASQEAIKPALADASAPTITTSELASWAKAGATNADAVLALLKEGIAPGEVTKTVVVDGKERTILWAIEHGRIRAFDAAAVCAFWPGEGWTFSSERFCYERPMPVEVLARLARAHAGAELAPDIDDERLGARMAAEIMRQSSDVFGIDLVITRGPDAPVVLESWDSELPPELFELAAKETAQAVGSREDPLHNFAERWLSGGTGFSEKVLVSA